MSIDKDLFKNKKNNFICSLYQVEHFLNNFAILIKTKNFIDIFK